jgi:hypothetical protein
MRVPFTLPHAGADDSANRTRKIPLPQAHGLPGRGIFGHAVVFRFHAALK